MDTGTGNGMTQEAADLRFCRFPALQTATPTTGQTVTMTDDDRDRTLWIKPAAPLLALTIVFPTSATSRLGRIVRIGCTKAVTTLALSGPVSILNAEVAFAINDIFSYQEVETDTWLRIA